MYELGMERVLGSDPGAWVFSPQYQTRKVMPIFNTIFSGFSSTLQIKSNLLVDVLRRWRHQVSTD